MLNDSYYYCNGHKISVSQSQGKQIEKILMEKMNLLQCFDVSSLHIYVLNHYYLVMLALS
jgi:hypothetical protein